MIKNIKQFLFIAGLLLVAAGAQPVGAAFWQWSTTASNNANADPTINWSEGMSPSSVNDSARAMMAVLAAYRIDNGGSLIVGGTSTAYTLATQQPFASTSDLDGQSIAFIVTPTNGASPTLNVNGIGAFPLVTEAGAPVASGVLHDGRIYHVTYRSANNSFRVHDVLDDAYNVALGAIMWSTSPTPPNSNFVAPYGQCISTTTYAAYWAQQGSPASGSCPGGQFAIIDLRGRVLAGLDTLPGSIAANRMTNASTGCGVAFNSVGAVCTESQSVTLSVLNLPPYTPSGSITNGSVTISGAGSLRNVSGDFNNNGGGGGAFSAMSSAAPSLSGSISPSTFAGSAQGGTSTPFSKVQPTMGLIPYLRVL